MIEIIEEIIIKYNLRKKERTRANYYRRMIIATVLSDLGYTTIEIGKKLNRDHSTIVYYLGQYENVVKFCKDARDIEFETLSLMAVYNHNWQKCRDEVKRLEQELVMAKTKMNNMIKAVKENRKIIFKDNENN